MRKSFASLLFAPRFEIALLERVYWVLVAVSVLGIVGGMRTHASIAIWLSACVLLFLVYAGFVEPRWVRVARHRVSLVPEPSEWIRLVFLSDFHAGGFKGPSYYRRLTKRVAQLAPDIVVLGGDYVDEFADPVRDLSSLQELHPPLGKYALLGNHDYIDRPECIREHLTRWGYGDLTNQTVSIEKQGRSFSLVGLDEAWFGAPDVHLLRAAMSQPRVVIAHEPDSLLDIEAGEASLVVMGHTHGGQIRIPFSRFHLPLPQNIPQTYDRGRKEWKGIPVLISQGLGEATSRVRVACPPEILVIEIGV